MHFKILHNTYTSCGFEKYKRVLNDILYRQVEKNVGILLCLSFIGQWALFCIAKNQPILVVVYTFALYFGCALSFLKFTFLSFRFDILIQYMHIFGLMPEQLMTFIRFRSHILCSYFIIVQKPNLRWGYPTI